MLNQIDIGVVGRRMERKVSDKRGCGKYCLVLGLIFCLVMPVCVNAQLDAGIIGISQCIVSGVSPSAFTSIRDGITGAGIAVSWERADDNAFTTNLIQVSTGSQTYTEGVLASDKYYRRKVTNGSSAVFSNVIRVAVSATRTDPTFTVSAPPYPIVCQKVTSFPVNYTSSHSPDTYSIFWDATAAAAGFQDAVNLFLPATPGSLNVAVPSTAPAATYSGTLVAVISGTGCSVFNTSTVKVKPLPTLIVSASTAITTGMSTTLIASGSGVGTITFAWTPSTSLSATSGSSVIASPTSTISYTVTATDSYAPAGVDAKCTNTATTNIIVNPVLSAGSIGTNHSVCINTSATTLTSLADASNGTGTKLYQWQQSTDNISFTNIVGANASTYSPGVLSQTTYFKRGVSTSLDATVYTNTVTVTVNPLPIVAAINGNNTVCVGSTISLSNATSGGVWGSGTTSVGTINATGVLTGVSSGATTISYTVTNNNGCVTAVTSVKTINPLPAVNAITGNSGVCAGSNITLSNATSGGVWSSGTTTVGTINANGVLTGVSSGLTLISYTVTDNNGCVNAATSIRTINSLPILFINTPTICTPGLIDLTSPAIISIGSTANLSCTYWNNVLTTSALTNASAITATGIYYIKGTIAATGCAVTKAVTTTINPLPTVVITTPAAICAPGTIDLTNPAITSLGSTANLSYTQWNNAIATSALTNASAITATGIYYIKGTMIATGCAVTKAVTATINPLPTVVTSSQTVCAPGTIDFTSPSITAAGSTANLSYTQWNNALATSSLTNASAITATGIYYIKGTLPATGCAVTKAVTATIVTAPSISITNPAAVCAPATVDITSAAVTTGSTPGLSFSYFTNAANTNVLASPNAVNASGTYYIKGFAGSTGCVSSQPVTVTINPLPNGVLQTPSVNYICNGLSVLLTAFNANSYQWFFNKQPVTGAVTNTYAATNAGDYTVRFISAAGCVQDATNTITLSLLAKPLLQFSENGSCAGSPIRFTNQSAFASSGSINWHWNFGDGSVANIFSPVYTYPTGGDYTIVLTANNVSCPSFTDSIAVPYHIEAPRIPYRYATVNAVGGLPTMLSSRNAGSVYLWKPATGLNDARLQFPTATLNSDVEYTITINSAAGCTVTDTVLVKVTIDGSIYVAQAFTPNGDGVNDRCYPIAVGIRSLTYFKIFNRWGNVVFQTNDLTPQNGWDGKWNGKIQPPGTYQWIAEAIDGAGNIIKKTGSVLLVN